MKKLLLTVFFCSAAFKAAAQEQCGSVAECAQKAMEAALQAKVVLQIAVPKGAVMAFNLDECPAGWVAFSEASGRVIIGSGAGQNLTQRARGQRGGRETVALTADQLPRHRHAMPFVPEASNLSGNSYPVMSDARHSSSSRANAYTSSNGASAAHENMPPFHVLTYCERK